MDIFTEKSSDFLQLRFCIATELWQQTASCLMCHPFQPASARGEVQKGPSLRVTLTGAAHLYLQRRETSLVIGTLFLSSLCCQVEELAKAFQMRDYEFSSQSLILQAQTMYNP